MSRSLAEIPAIAGTPEPVVKPQDPRLERARPRLGGFLFLVFQLALVVGVLHGYRVGQYGGAEMTFTYLCDAAFGLFAVHYWLPYRMKETFWVAASLVAAFIWLDWRVATCLVVAGCLFFAIIRSPLPYWTRVGMIVTGFAIASLCSLYPNEGNDIIRMVSPVGVPKSTWMMFGSIFLLRMIVYLHDVRYLKTPPSFRAYLAYFFILPNYIFPLMPVVDYTTMRASYYRRNIQDIAQQGIHWIGRGLVQLVCYQVIYYLREAQTARGIDSFGAVVSYMVLTFLLYLRVSGQFHLAIGMLHLFGYDLPETNRKYLLSASLTDWWRRVNIYWKDFMVKIVYFPVFFRFRKGGQLRAKLLATVAVFLVTWALHSYQYLWIRGEVLFNRVDITFWGIFGLLITVNVWWEHKQEASGVRPVPSRLGTFVSTVGTMSLIIFLWSLWEAPTFSDWFELVAWWRKG